MKYTLYFQVDAESSSLRICKFFCKFITKFAIEIYRCTPIRKFIGKLNCLLQILCTLKERNMQMTKCTHLEMRNMTKADYIKRPIENSVP